MTDPTSNLNQVQADTFFVWDPASKTYVNLQSSIVGLAPSTLSMLQALAAAVNNDPQFSTNLAATTTALQTSISTKAPLASPSFSGTVGGLTKSMVGLSHVDDTPDIAKPVSSAVQTALDLKASSASVTASLNALIGGAPDALNTLNELAVAIESDPSYSTTVLTALNGKQVKFVHGHSACVKCSSSV